MCTDLTTNIFQDGRFEIERTMWNRYDDFMLEIGVPLDGISLNNLW